MHTLHTHTHTHTHETQEAKHYAYECCRARYPCLKRRVCLIVFCVLYFCRQANDAAISLEVSYTFIVRVCDGTTAIQESYPLLA